MRLSARRSLSTGVSLVALLAAAAAHGQDRPAGDGGTTPAAAVTLPSVLVTAPLQPEQDDLPEGSSVLTGGALDQRRADTLGETLDHLPGVSATQFGAGASRPIIRGQSGPRVRVMSNGLDSFDASTVSPDHAVLTPVTGAERIEVLRGPSTLLYGSSAIGGVVNVIDGRIPDAVPKNGVSGETRLDYGSGAHERTGFAGINAAVTDRFVVHAEGGFTDADDYSINGYASDEAREAGIKGRVDTSGVRNRNGAIGASYLGDAGYAGLAVSQTNTYYGVPGDDPVHIDMTQRRLDAKAGMYDLFGFLDELSVKLGYGDYQHDEIEDTGEIATRFNANSWELRMDAVHRPIGPVQGTFGVQSSHRSLGTTGEETIFPATDTDSNALFAVERYEAGPWLFTLGGRIERTEVDADALNSERSFTPASLSGSATYHLGGGWSTGLTLSRTERAPTAEELFSNGPHDATRSFEIGDTNLDKETAKHVEVSLRQRGENTGGALNVFATHFDNYIYGAFTGNQQDGLDELQCGQTKALFRGFELEGDWTFWKGNGWRLGVDGNASYVRADDTRNDNSLPLIPPFGYMAGITAGSDAVDLRFEVVGVLDQDRAGVNETTTNGYTVLNTAITWRPLAENRNLALHLQGRNLTDAEGRNHTSLLKDVAPIRGREVRLGASFSF